MKTQFLLNDKLNTIRMAENEIYQWIKELPSSTISNKLGMGYQKYLYKIKMRKFTEIELHKINLIYHDNKLQLDNKK